jgi:hypothetical protein
MRKFWLAAAAALLLTAILPGGAFAQRGGFRGGGFGGGGFRGGAIGGGFRGGFVRSRSTLTSLFGSSRLTSWFVDQLTATKVSEER